MAGETATAAATNAVSSAKNGFKSIAPWLLGIGVLLIAMSPTPALAFKGIGASVSAGAKTLMTKVTAGKTALTANAVAPGASTSAIIPPAAAATPAVTIPAASPAAAFTPAAAATPAATAAKTTLTSLAPTLPGAETVSLAPTLQ